MPMSAHKSSAPICSDAVRILSASTLELSDGSYDQRCELRALLAYLLQVDQALCRFDAKQKADVAAPKVPVDVHEAGDKSHLVNRFYLGNEDRIYLLECWSLGHGHHEKGHVTS